MPSVGALTGAAAAVRADERLELVDGTLHRSGHAETLFEQELLDDQPTGLSIEPHVG